MYRCEQTAEVNVLRSIRWASVCLALLACLPPGEAYGQRQELDRVALREIPPAADYAPGRGVKVSPLTLGLTPSNWLATAVSPTYMTEDPRRNMGKWTNLLAEVGGTIEIGGRALTFAPVSPDRILPSQGIALPRRSTVGTQALFAVLKIDTPKAIKIRMISTGTGQAQMLLNGRAVSDGEIVSVAAGLYPVLIVARFPRYWEFIAAGFDRVGADDLMKLQFEPTHIVKVKLLEKSPMPDRGTTFVYQEALAAYRYRVVEVVKGVLQAPTILVTHWILYRNNRQPAADMAIGDVRTLKLRRFNEMPALQATVLSDTTDDLEAPIFHDIGTKLQLPAYERGRWSYNVELSQKMPLFFELRSQLKLVVLGDCQAACAHRAELYYGDENRITPVAYNLCQERAGLAMHKLLVDDYLLHLPKLEWVLLSWNPRYVNASWKTHGMKLAQFRSSRGYTYDKKHPEQFDAVKNAEARFEPTKSGPSIA